MNKNQLIIGGIIILIIWLVAWICFAWSSLVEQASKRNHEIELRMSDLTSTANSYRSAINALQIEYEQLDKERWALLQIIEWNKKKVLK